jgi:hypothetical protein
MAWNAWAAVARLEQRVAVWAGEQERIQAAQQVAWEESSKGRW